MGSVDSVMARVGQGIAMGGRGERAAARRLFTVLWTEIVAERGDPFQRCAVAHSMADVQDDVHDELMWDLQAWAAADGVTDGRVASAGVAGPAAGFYPSLHLNLADCYRRLGDVAKAREHVRLGREALDVLGQDGYREMVRRGLDRLSDRLDGSSQT